VRALTINLFAQQGDWPARREVLRAGLRQLRPDVVTLQEAIVDGPYDQVVELLGPDYAVAHQRVGLIGDGRHHGASVASRWPITAVHEVDLHLTDRTWDYSCGAVIAEVDAPVGRLLVVCHGNSWAWWAERERELQALALLRRIEELAADEPAHVLVGGDFNATPDTASMRLFTGRQSLDCFSTAYRDCWESIHGHLNGYTVDPANPLRASVEPGLTFEPGNPLSTIDEPGLDRGRRIDYLLVRCGDHGPTLRVTDCRLALHEPLGGVQPSDHYGVLADLVPATEPAGGRGGGAVESAGAAGESPPEPGGRPIVTRPAGEPGPS
jgi:endonuclease/exonuclease/phosphatase family metal-dependent hydrolase